MKYRPTLLILLALGACQFGGSGELPVAAEMYDPCDFAAECPEPATMCGRIRVPARNTTVIGAVCTLECSDSTQCPADGACAAVDTTSGLSTCQRQCTQDEECAENYFCSTRATVDLGQVGLCIPICIAPDAPGGPTFGC